MLLYNSFLLVFILTKCDLFGREWKRESGGWMSMRWRVCIWGGKISDGEAKSTLTGTDTWSYHRFAVKSSSKKLQDMTKRTSKIQSFHLAQQETAFRLRDLRLDQQHLFCSLNLGWWFHKYLKVPGSDSTWRRLQSKRCPFVCLFFVDTWRCDEAVLDVSCASEEIKSVFLDSSFVRKPLYWRRPGRRIMKLICRCCQNVLGAHRWWRTAAPAGAGVSGSTTRADPAVHKQSGEMFGWKTATSTQSRRSVNTV